MSAVAEKTHELNFRLLGILPLIFFLAQATHYWLLPDPGEISHMFWPCNIGNLLLAIGLFTNRAPLIRVAALWMIPGLVVWFVYVVLAWGIFLTSTLVHVGGVTVAIIAVRSVGMDRDSWLYAFGGYLLLQLLSRLITPPALNVNLAHSVYAGWQSTFNAYWKFWMVITLATVAILFGLGMLMWKIWPAPRSEVALIEEPGVS